MELGETFRCSGFGTMMRDSYRSLDKICFSSQFFLGDLYSAFLKGCSIASMNCGEISCGPFLFSLLNTEEDKRGIGVVMISIRPVEYSG